MARIRSIKPEFFRHFKLYQAEMETKLPLRLAFAGLWTACDREGRFLWEPESLKLDALPYDQVDFHRVLDELVKRGFLVRYARNNEVYGCIPSWKKYQVINNKEKLSEIPAPSEEEIKKSEEIQANSDAWGTREERVEDALGTREARVGHASTTSEEEIKKTEEIQANSDALSTRGVCVEHTLSTHGGRVEYALSTRGVLMDDVPLLEGEGVGVGVGKEKRKEKGIGIEEGYGEGKGEGEGKGKEKKPKPLPPACFDLFWKVYPRKVAKQDAIKAFKSLAPDQPLVDTILAAVGRAVKSPEWLKDGGQFIPYPATWLRGRRWEDQLTTTQAIQPRRIRIDGEWFNVNSEGIA